MARVLNKYKDSITRNSVYIGRPGPFGNPFSISITSSRDEVIEKYEDWVNTQPELLKRIKKELRGKDLVCFCSPLRCHGDIILRIANE